MKKRNLIAATIATATLVLAPVISAAATTQSVGGGLWTYGTTASIVYSYYHHPSRYHSATACDNGIIGSCVQKSAAAGAWARAETGKSWTGGNTAYWNTY